VRYPATSVTARAVAAAAALLSSAAATLHRPAVAQSRPPNIVFILADDLGVNDLGIYDDERVELFDLDADAGETRDLSTAEPARAAALRKRLRDWRTSVGAQENTPNPSVDLDLYKKIYVDFDSTRFDPLRADDAAWKSVATWRERMDAAIKRQAK